MLLKTFKKMFKALDTHYISKGAEHNVNHVRNAQKASKKMCKIFTEAYNIVAYENTNYVDNIGYQIRNEVEEQTQTTEETPFVSTSEPTVVTNTAESMTLQYNPYANDANVWLSNAFFESRPYTYVTVSTVPTTNDGVAS